MDEIFEATTFSREFIRENNEYGNNWDDTNEYPGLNEADIGSSFTNIFIKCVIGLFLVLLILISIVGNILVCLALSTDRRLRKLGNLFLASLALADLFVASLVMTFAVANDLMGYWAFGPIYCEIWIAFDISCCTCSILNLCAISLDRFMYIKNPLKYNRLMTKKVVLSAVAAIWIMSGLVSFVPIGLGWHKDPSKNSEKIISESNKLIITNNNTHCALDLTPTYAIVSSTISFYLPCCIMIALYAKLYSICKQHVKSIKSMTKPLHHDGQNYSNHHHHITEHKAAITLGIIMGTFLACWTPFFCMNIIAPFCNDCIPLIVFKALTWLGYINSSLNPAIYSIFNTEFREAFRRIIITYIVRDECCGPRMERDNSSRLEHDHKINSERALTINASSNKHFHKINNQVHRSSSGNTCEVIPVKDKIELSLSHLSDAKISDI